MWWWWCRVADNPESFRVSECGTWAAGVGTIVHLVGQQIMCSCYKVSALGGIKSAVRIKRWHGNSRKRARSDTLMSGLRLGYCCNTAACKGEQASATDDADVEAVRSVLNTAELRNGYLVRGTTEPTTHAMMLACT